MLDHSLDDPEHFEEGLVHLVDMLALADPRSAGGKPDPYTAMAGAASPATAAEEWKRRCRRAIEDLEAARARLSEPARRERLDRAIAQVRDLL